MFERMSDLTKQALKAAILIVITIFVLYNLFTDPVGSAAWVSSVIHGIVSAIQAIITFATNVHS